ncbi:MAG TPA: cytochrome c [Candidatus Acidoferrales bacterium]|nr:cytochrome c [Candidatus Acidoferrales bacterium]
MLRNLDHVLKCNASETPCDERWGRRGLILALLLAVASCGEPAPKTDAELGLNAQQSAGRRVFERDCSACHSAYSSSGTKGPSLKDVFHKKFLPSGLPATDRFVEQTIVGGRNMMPPMGEAITQQELDDLMAYLHTL